MNVFSTHAFLETAGALFFPDHKRSIELFRVEGRILRLLVVDGRVVRSMPFYDFPQPLDAAPPGEPVNELAFFPRTVMRTEPIAQRTGKEPEGVQPSPYIDWSTVPSYEAWETMVAARGGVKSGDSARQLRRIARDLGDVKFVLDDQRPEVFDAIVKWKSAQYVSTGVGDMFARPDNVEFFHRLRTAGLLRVSSFSAGPHLLAAHFGSSHDRRLTWWIPAYDTEYRKYSPGRLMLLELIRESQQRGDLEFDFLIGDEDYKFLYATHNRRIGPVGTMPLGEMIIHKARKRARAALDSSPRALNVARELKKRFLT